MGMKREKQSLSVLARARKKNLRAPGRKVAPSPAVDLAAVEMYCAETCGMVCQRATEIWMNEFPLQS